MCGMNKGAPGCCADKKTAAVVAAHEAMAETTQAMTESTEGLSSADPDAVLDAAEATLEGMQDVTQQATEALEALQDSAVEVTPPAE